MKQKQRVPTEAGRPRLTQMALPGVVLILVGLILSIKAYQATVDTANSPPYQFAPTLQAASAAGSPEQAAPVADLPPETQLDQFLAAGKPTLAFFHSNDCVQCVKMIKVVEQVYPDFVNTVALVDVNVYDERNQNLLHRADIRAIPTLIFIDGDGEGKGYMGLMKPDIFRNELQRLAEE
jgi:thiol:disulfide interchange protein